MDPVLEVIGRHAIVPVVAIEDAEKAVPLARALKAGGLPLAEITFRTAAAKAAIQAITEAEPDVLVGAGTVRTPQQVDDAIAAGARFLVSPGCNPTTIRRARDPDHAWRLYADGYRDGAGAGPDHPEVLPGRILWRAEDP